MKITLDLKKTIEQNAQVYFEKSKKAKKKMEGAKKALAEQEKKFLAIEKQTPKAEKVVLTESRKKHWYEKFRWFKSSEGFLVIGGRDATTNEIVIKKHAEKNDVVFHTDMAGSPFVVIKVPEGEVPGEITLQEATDFTASHSKGWKLGMASLPVFWVKPDQVTKEAQSGEYLQKGSFMIRGKTNYITPTMNYAVGIHESAVMAGPISAIKKNCEEIVELVQGNDKISEIAKKVQKKLPIDLDEIVRAIPPGSKIKVEKKRKN